MQPIMSLSGPTSLQFSCFCLITPFPKEAPILAHWLLTPPVALVVLGSGSQVVVPGQPQHVQLLLSGQVDDFPRPWESHGISLLGFAFLPGCVCSSWLLGGGWEPGLSGLVGCSDADPG